MSLPRTALESRTPSAPMSPSAASSRTTSATTRARRVLRTRVLAALAAASLLVAACGADEAPERLTLLTHDSFDVSEDVLAEFTARTGIVVEVLRIGDTGTALNRAILTKDDPEGDLLFGVDTAFLSRALDEGLFTPYRATGLEQVPDEFDLDERVTPIGVADVCINYDVAWFETAGLVPPTSFEDLADPAYRSLLTVMDPAGSSPGLVFLLATIDHFGEDAAFEYWAALRDNDVLVADSWSSGYYGSFSAASEDGSRPLVVSYATSPAAEVFFAEEALAQAPTGVVDATCFRQIEFVGILAASPRQTEAQRLVDFMLSTTFQEDMPLTMFVFPVRSDAGLPDVFRAHATFGADVATMTPERISTGRDGWIERFTGVVLR